MSDVFYGGGGKKQLDVFFFAKKAVNECWGHRQLGLSLAFLPSFFSVQSYGLYAV
jgi:hypothetical protein